MTLAAGVHQSHRLGDEPGNGFLFKGWKNETEGPIMKSGLGHFRVLCGSNKNDAYGDRSFFHDVDEVDPGTVGKLGIRKNQLRVSLLKEPVSILASPNAESIHPETPENRFQRFKGLGALVCYKRKGIVLQGIPLPGPQRPEFP